MEKITEELRKHAKKLLGDKTVDMVIGYGYEPGDNKPSTVFIRKPEDTDSLVFDRFCFHNLVTYLKKDSVAKLKKVAVVVKGCDRRAINVLIREKIIDRDKVHIIGVSCYGVGEPESNKCVSCDVYYPADCDIILGEKAEREPKDHFARVDEFEKKSVDERWDFWKEHFDRCIRCYACRQVCPICTCSTCIADKNMPQWIDSSSHLRGNLSWHVVRAFHLTGRCVACGECERVCPVDIPLGLLNSKMAKLMKEEYGFVSGMSAEEKEPFVTYNLEDSDKGIL